MCTHSLDCDDGIKPLLFFSYCHVTGRGLDSIRSSFDDYYFTPKLSLRSLLTSLFIFDKCSVIQSPLDCFASPGTEGYTEGINQSREKAEAASEYSSVAHTGPLCQCYQCPITALPHVPLTPCAFLWSSQGAPGIPMKQNLLCKLC